MPYLFMIITLAAAVAGQLLLKKGLLVIGQIPQSLSEFVPFFFKVFTNIYVLSAVVLWVVAALAWILAVSKGELGHILPFMGISFALVALFSTIIFKENIAAWGWLGIALVCTGVFLVTKG